MKKPDLSKVAMQKFFLYHTEKLILGLAVLLLGLFFWMGFKSPVFDEKTPDQLSQMADNADRFIRSDASWDSIKEFRKGNDKVLDIIINAEGNVKPGAYNIDPFTGIAAATLAPRTDPVVLPVIEPHATVFTSPLIVAMGGPIKTNPFQEFPIPPSTYVATGGIAPSNAFGSSDDAQDFDDDFEDSEEDMDEAEEAGGFGGGRTGGGRGGRGGSDTKVEIDELPEMDGVGTELRTANADTFSGMRPTTFGIPSTTSKSYIYDVVCVTGLVDYKQQFNSFDKSFSSGVGFYPKRDKPIYQHLQVERREVDAQGNPLKGKNGEWTDQSELIMHNVPRRFPQMHQMPNALYSSAPDIVAPNNYDPVLTQPIPPIVMFDYLPLVNHPKLADNTREFPELVAEIEYEDLGPDRIFETPEAGDTGFGGPAFGGGRQMGGGGSTGRGGGGRSGGGRGGMGGEMGGRSGGGTGTAVARSNQGPVIPKATRNGSDFTDYWNALEAKSPTADYRLVRFFDVLAKAGSTYEYRMRVWVGDPNNEDPNQQFSMLQGNQLEMSSGMAGMGEDDYDDYDESEEMDDMEDELGSQTNNAGIRQPTAVPGAPAEKVYVKVNITSTMTHPTVRIRLNRIRSVSAGINPQTNLPQFKYFVSESRGTDAEGKEIVEEIPVPNERPYLRFARPSDWSKPITVKVESNNSQVAAGGVEPPKTARVRVGQVDKYFPISEPVSEVVASVWSTELGTAMPTKQKVFRGDALNFNAPAHILHPITWQVLVAKNASTTAEGGAKFLFDINTDNVVVDAIGGGELDLPRSEKMRHNSPSEVLVMNEFGEFQVKNDLDDRTTYRNLLFLPDESQIVGKKKVKKAKEDDDRGLGRGGRGSSDEDEDF